MEKIVCKKCKKEIDSKEFLLNLNVCPYCNFHDYISARERLQITVDEGSFKEFAGEINSVDTLNFYDLKAYKDRLTEAKLKSGLNEAVVTGEAKLAGNKISVGVMDFNFMGGSMGSVVGEHIKILADNSIANRIPLIIFAASGGAHAKRAGRRARPAMPSLLRSPRSISASDRRRTTAPPTAPASGRSGRHRAAAATRRSPAGEESR